MVAKTRKRTREASDPNWSNALNAVPQSDGYTQDPLPAISEDDDMGMEELLKIIGESDLEVDGTETQVIDVDDDEDEPETPPEQGVQMTQTQTPRNGNVPTQPPSLMELVETFARRGSEIDSELEQLRVRTEEVLREKARHEEVRKLLVEKLSNVTPPKKEV